MFYTTVLRLVLRALYEALAGLVSLPYLVVNGLGLSEIPQMHYSESELASRVKTHVTALRSYFPCPWSRGPHAQTLFAMINTAPLPKREEREVVQMPDNVGIILDWYAAPGTPDDAPIILTLHGLAGDENAQRPILTAEWCIKTKWRSAFFLRRGHGSSSLLPTQAPTPSQLCGVYASHPATPVGSDHPTSDGMVMDPSTPHTTPRKPMVKAFPAHADVDDMARVLIHMRAKYPKAPMLAIGFSMGSNVLVKYLGQYGQSPLNPLIGAVCAASGYDIVEGTQALSTDKTRELSDRMMTVSLQKLLRQKLHEVNQLTMTHDLRVDLGEVLASRNIRKFDAALMLPLYGYKDIDDYYADNNCRPYFKDVRVPLLCISARDDPIIHPHLLRHAIEATRANRNIFLAITEKGGHLGWLEGWRAKSWWLDVMDQFMHLILQMHADKLLDRPVHVTASGAVMPIAATPAATITDMGPTLDIPLPAMQADAVLYPSQPRQVAPEEFLMEGDAEQGHGQGAQPATQAAAVGEAHVVVVAVADSKDLSPAEEKAGTEGMKHSLSGSVPTVTCPAATAPAVLARDVPEAELPVTSLELQGKHTAPC